MLELPGGVAVLLVALTISVTSDPRKMRTALYLLALLIWLLMSAVGLTSAPPIRSTRDSAATPFSRCWCSCSAP